MINLHHLTDCIIFFLPKIKFDNPRKSINAPIPKQPATLTTNATAKNNIPVRSKDNKAINGFTIAVNIGENNNNTSVCLPI